MDDLVQNLNAEPSDDEYHDADEGIEMSNQKDKEQDISRAPEVTRKGPVKNEQSSGETSKSLYSRVIVYLSDSATSVPTKVTDDPVVFAMIMSEFRVYEQHKQTRDANDIKKILDVLMKRINQVFDRDFPFYFCIAGRMMRAKSAYHNVSSFEKFYTVCADKFEQLSCEVIANTLETFFSRHNPSPNEENVFEFMEYAFEKLGKKRCRNSTPTKFWPLMLWVSVILKIKMVLKSETNPEHMWSAYLRKVSHVCELNIAEVIHGQHLGTLLTLPIDSQFTYKHLLHMMTPTATNRSVHVPTFHEQKNALAALPESLTEKEFIDYVGGIINYYGGLFSWKPDSPMIKHITGQSTNSAAIVEGIRLMDLYHSFVTRQGWDQKKFKVQSWLCQLCKFINFKHHPQDCIRAVFSQGSEVVTMHMDSVITSVTGLMEQNLKSMSIDQFNSILECTDIWEKTLIAKFLQEFSIHSQHRLKDCQPLLTTLDRRKHLIPDLKIIWKFFMMFADSVYGRIPGNFVLELLRLQLPELLCSSVNTLTKEELEANMRVYIKSDERIPRRLLTLVDVLLKSIAEERNGVHKVILSAVLKETITLPKTSSTLVLKAIETMALQLVDNISWVEKAPNQRELFCLDFISSYLDSIQVDNGSFEWGSRCENNESTVLSILNVYNNYIVKSNCQPTVEQIPDSIQYNESQSVKKMFQWVLSIESFFTTWRERFTKNLINYDQIMAYKKHRRVFQIMSRHMKVEELVCSEQEVKDVKHQYENQFKMLNSLLLKPVPGDGQRKMCSIRSALQKFNLQFPERIHDKLNHHVRLPTEQSQLSRNWNPLKSPLLAREEQCVQLSQDLLLSDLSELVHDLTTFLHPLNTYRYLDILAFFHKRSKSIMFNTYLKNFSKTERDGVEDKHKDQICDEYNYLGAFFNALQKTVSLVMNIISGEATYGESVIDHELNLSTLDVDSEFSALLNCPDLETGNDTGQVGLKCMLKLMQFEAQYYDSIVAVCEQYHFESFHKDQELQKVKEIVRDVRNEENFHQLTGTVAQEKWQCLEDILKIKGKNMECLKLFAKISDCVDFYHFLNERKFVGSNCAEVFRSQLRLIGQQIEHDITDHDMMVMDHLYSSISFMAPFLNQSQTFENLMTSLSVMDTTTGLSQLDTVRSNMHLIHVWFSKAQDNLENVAVELDCIWNNGRYCFDIANETVLLKFEQSQVLVVSSSYPGSKLTAVVKWKKEQVKDFIHKLGFLECNEEQRKKQDTFMAVTDTANKVMKIFVDLRDKGNPDYFMADENAVQDLSCSCDISQLNEMVARAQKTLSDWNKIVETLHSKYKWLLFFRVPKLMQLCKYLQTESVQGICQEIQFLLERKGNSSEKQSILNDIKEAFARVCQESDTKPLLKMEVIGSILRILFTEKGYCIRSRTEAFRQLGSAMASIATIGGDTLFSTSSICHSKLIYLVLNIYQGIPEPFEYLRCSPTTTEEELKIFMKRVLEHPRMYIILNVNSLPHFLQEVLLQEYLEFRHLVVYSDSVTTIHFVESAPSVLREIPWLKLLSIEDELLSSTEEKNSYQVKKGPSLKCVELVYGLPGDGKTHYIREELLKCRDSSCCCTIVINETFNLKTVIEKLRKLPSKNCRVHFNITTLLTNDTKKDSLFNLADEIGWFFFDLLLLGYIEDPPTGLSFSFPHGTSWNIYIEVPCRTAGISAEQNMKDFLNEFPVVDFIGTQKLIDSTRPFKVDDGVQLVCKYLKRFDTNKIDLTLPSIGRAKIQFSNDRRLSEDDCRKLLNKYMDKHFIKNNKTDQKLFVSYMKRRCSFLDNLPAFNFNYGRGYVKYGKGKKKDTDTTKLGSTLMSSMLKEVEHFCDPRQVDDWTRDPHQQLIYDIDPDGGGAIGLISLHPEQIPQADRAKFVALGIKIPSMKDLYERSTLDKWLSRALGLQILEYHNNSVMEKESHSAEKSDRVEMEPEIQIKLIDDMKYVLTLDYTLKMLNIHERRECGIPVIIEGETGVGKTALIEMLSQLWNHSWLNQWELLKCKMLLDDLEKKLEGIVPEEVESFQEICDIIHNIKSHRPVSKEQMLLTANLPHKGDLFYHHVMKKLLVFKNDPILSMLDIDLSELKNNYSAIEKNGNPEGTAQLMELIFNAKIRSVFYKLNIHAALQPHEIYDFFSRVRSHANDLNHAYSEGVRGNLRVPLITVYLDEINTSSFIGILKEIITDRTIDGEPIPDNIFIIAACNPLRADSLAIYRDTVSETWLKAAYCVQRLHPSLRQLIWDYAALNKSQEKQYISAKMDLLNTNLSPAECDSLNGLIIESQEKMREYALDHISKLGDLDRHEAQLCSRSCVSQRDIQRVFTFYTWLIDLYKEYNPHNENEGLFHRRAVMVALGLVYYMRLNSEYRKNYQTLLDTSDALVGEVTFSVAYEAALQWFTDQLELPSGIAKTIALKENVFATAVCTMTRTPLIIVGDPGTSKTISFNIVTANLKGKESKIELFRNAGVFKSLDPHFYQCSKRTTSNEIEKVFTRAIKRQHYLAKVPLPVLSVVLMDEAGLPERDMESLKALHYYLDEQEVSFVAISNHVLDAAKTNRAISLFRPKASSEELKELALASLINGEEDVSEKYTMLIDALVKAYVEISDDKEHKSIFGLRDFIFLVTHLRRQIIESKISLSLQMIVKGLERNFNGTDQFMELCEVFLKYCYVGITIEARFRNILRVMKESLEDCSMKETSSIHSSVQSEVRHMLIIDCSEDSSVIRLVFQRGILPYQHLRLYVCGDFPGDIQDGSSDMRVNTISQIRHSVAAGHTVLMCQTEEIHECFYDLFNQRYSVINDPKSNRCHYYTNIAIGAHSKPCKVDPHFRCIVVVKEEDLSRTPMPFLNRFEKYRISHDVIYKKVFDSTAKPAQLFIDAVYKRVKEFAENSKFKFSDYLYGYRTEDTIKSLMLTVMPSEDHEYKPYTFSEPDEDDCQLHVHSFLLKTIAHAMHLSAGFNIKLYDSNSEELEFDVRHLFQLLKRDPEYVHLNQLEHQQVPGLVDEALNVLYYRRHDDEPISVYSDTCMIISLVFHWLVMNLCKRLMQLMIAEALPAIRDCIPTYYIEHYLIFQNHFSIKKLIAKHLREIQQSNGAVGIPTKLMCFSRSSPLIRQLPTEFPTHDDSTLQQKDIIQQYIIDDVESLVLCKLSSRHSQTNLEDIINSFTKSKYKVLMFIVDAGMNFYQQSLKETSRLKENISHLRMMIEEAELHSSSDQVKVFVVLIHFPPARLLAEESCYPALFLKGWDHYYLDTIADGTLTRSGTMASVVNVEQWLYSCLVKPADKTISLPCYEMEQNVEDILRDAIPSVASRLNLRSDEDDYKTFLDVSSKTLALNHILFSGEARPSSEEGVGTVLARCFSKYWNSRQMNRYLQKFTSLTFLRKSTLNLTASVETTFRSLFVDFLVYRLSRMEVTFDIYMLLDSSVPQCLVKCLLGFLEHLPLPRLEQLSQLSDLHIVDICPPPKHIPKFPFLPNIFKSISSIIEKADDEVKVEVYKQLAPGVEVQDDSINQMSTNERIKKCFTAVNEKITKVLEENEDTPTLLGQLLYMLKKYPQVWEYYFHEVVQTKVDPQGTLGTNVFLIRYIRPFRTLTDSEDCVHHFINFHIHIYVHRLDILRVERALKPLTILSTSGSLSESKSPLDVEHRSDLSAYIVNKLYDFVCTIEPSQMKQWLNCFHKILSIQAIVDDVFCSQAENIDKKFILMHTAYLIASAGESDELCSVAHKYFLQMKNSISNINRTSNELYTLSTEAIKMIEQSSLNKEDKDKCSKTFMEDFLLFSFSESRFPYPEDDCEWFYKIANKQLEHWFEYSSLGVFYLTLTRILGLPTIQSDSEDHIRTRGSSDILNLFDVKKRDKIGEVLFSGKESEDITPFIPAMYTKLDESLELHQPLAELYFSVVLKHLKQMNKQELYLIRLTKKLTETVSSSSNDHERYLCLIEREAVVHALLECVSSRLDPKSPNEARDLVNRRLHIEIGNIICNEPKVVVEGTTEVPACLFTLAYNLQRQVKSSDWLMNQLQDDESAVIQVFPAMQPLRMLIQANASAYVHSQMLFANEISGTTILCKLYEDLKVILEDIHTKRSRIMKFAERKLLNTIDEYCKNGVNVITCGGFCFDKTCALQMILWNCIYYNYYERKISSQEISNALTKLRPKYLEDCVLVLLQSFVCPKNMYQRLETTFSGRTDEERYRLTSSLRIQPIQPIGEQRDPLFDFFSLENSSRNKDPLETSLKKSLAHLVAATLACGRSSHLWYHMFESSELLDTHMTGFMYDHKVTSAHKYDCGVELSQEGLHGRPDYKARADKHHLSFPSWYLILWANFGAFCVGLITQPDGHEKIGTVLSQHHSDIRHMCVAQMKNFWLHVSLALDCTTEEISFFVRKAMAFHVKSLTCSATQEPAGKFMTLERVSSYEEKWHNDVYTKSYKELEKFDQHSTCEANQLQQKIRLIKCYHPIFPSEREFTQALQLSCDGSECKQKILYKFSVEHLRLKIGAKLLPDLIKLYNWIHRELKCLVEEKYARDNGLEEIITKGDKLFPNLGLCSLYEKVTVGYNEYVECIGKHIGAGACANVKRDGVIFHLTQDTKLVHMLSVDKETSGNDDDDHGWLLLVIMDIIRHHNDFLNDVHTTLSTDEQYMQQYCIIDENLKVLPEEVEESDCIVGYSDRFLQLIRCRHIVSGETLTFDYEKLEIDVVEEFILGKPIISDDIENLRIPFKYRKPMAVTVGVGISEAEVNSLSRYLGEDFQCELNDKHKKELECQLHAADHNKLNEITAGLLVSVNHLVKCLNLPDGPVNPKDLKGSDLRQFLLQLYQQTEDTSDAVLLEKIGIKNLTATEKLCLINLSISSLFATLKHLVQQIQIGVYDFCHLPIAMKKHINDCDDIIEKIHNTFTRTVSNEQLLREVEDMSKALIQCEMELQKDNKHCQEPLIPYIKVLSLVEESDLLPQIIPDTVLGAHYVSLHLLLRRVTDHCKRQVICHDKWDDFTPELWADGCLKYLRDVALPFDEGEFVYDPQKDRFKFQDSSDSIADNTQEEEFVFCDDENPEIPEIKEVTKQPDSEAVAVSKEASTTATTHPSDQCSQPDIIKPQKDLTEVAEGVTKEGVSVFLQEIKLHEYVQLFIDNDIDGQMLIVLNEMALKDLGVANIFHQKKIVNKFKLYLKEL